MHQFPVRVARQFDHRQLGLLLGSFLADFGVSLLALKNGSHG